MPLEYIENLPESALNEFMALNTLSPFTHDAQAYREGLIATLLYNNNITKKKDAKSVEDLFPYLSDKTPEWVEDERVLKAKNLLKSICCHAIDPDIYKSSFNEIKEKIIEEVEIEKSKDKPDRYVIDELQKLVKETE